jgi:5-methylcytosine-specific restriction endonuclease McrA
MKQFYAKNRGRINARMKKYREDDPDKVREHDRQRYERHRDKRIALAIDAAHARRQRIKKLGTPVRGISVRSLRQLHGDQCYYCSITMQFVRASGREFIPDKATIEHVIPLSVGGTHDWENCRLCCWQCNIRKNNKLAEQWAPGPAAVR